MQKIALLIRQNPVVVAALVRIAIYAGSYFGLHFDASQLAAEVGAIETVDAFAVRAKVTPSNGPTSSAVPAK